jgi:hypothetical protein
MHFEPKLLDNLFSAADHEKLRALIDSDDFKKSWKDSKKDRGVKRFTQLDDYFSKAIEPTAREIFSDPNLKSTYAVYLDYNKPTSSLPPHRDNNACTYTIDYCLSARTPWGVVVEGEEFIFSEGQALAFMGGYDSHWRNEMPDPDNNRVEVIMFHFCPEDHWYFTEGPDYGYKLQDQGLLTESESYLMSPKYLERLQQKSE